MEFTELKKRFIEIYGGSEENLRIFSAPGRVNLIGEHTDYNGGYVFPAALTMGTIIIARPRNDRLINMEATDLDVHVSASLDSLEEYKNLEWGNYQLGVADELQKAGYKLTGCDMLYHDTLPHGGGLSSSAAIQVSTALCLAILGNEAHGISEEIDGIKIAQIAQKSEHNYIGVNCGIMDQFTSSMGKANHAIFLDCKDLSYKLVHLDLKDAKIVISNTNKKRSLGQSKYNERRNECEKGLEMLKNAFPDAKFLGDISYSEFEANKHLIEDKIICKRVEHVISENDRVLKAVEALKADKIEEFGELMICSHNSLRDLYEVTGIELDTLVEEALKVDGVIGSRMTGAGFGGCTVSIVKENAVDKFIEVVGKNYSERVGLKASFYVSDIGDGGREI